MEKKNEGKCSGLIHKYRDKHYIEKEGDGDTEVNQIREAEVRMVEGTYEGTPRVLRVGSALSPMFCVIPMVELVSRKNEKCVTSGNYCMPMI